MTQTLQKIDVGVSNVFKRLHEAPTKIRVLEGGSGSSKTYSIIQFLIMYCRTNHDKGKRILVVRQKLTWLKLSVLSDFLKILQHMQVYDKNDFNKTESVYKLWGNEFHFTGLDEPQKVHGPRWDVLWGNEAIELSYEDVRQVLMRTNDLVVLDYNPSLTDHWIYDRVIPRDDATWILSTQLDNPYLPEEQRKEILSLEPTDFNKAQGTADQELWEIYGLGKRANIKGVIFKNVNYVKDFPDQCKWVCYGLDFGYSNDPTAVPKVGFHAGELWIDELIYESGLVNTPPAKDPNHKENISYKLTEIGLTQRDEIIADSAERKSIKELQLDGWSVRGAVKGPDSVNNGIDILKRFRINVTERSMNMRKEANNYKWMLDPKDPEGKRYLNKPVDKFNHLWDAIRYVAAIKIGRPKRGIRRTN